MSPHALPSSLHPTFWLDDPSGLAVLPGSGRLVVASTAGQVVVLAPPQLPLPADGHDMCERIDLPLMVLQYFGELPPRVLPNQSAEMYAGVCVEETSGRVLLARCTTANMSDSEFPPQPESVGVLILEPASALAHVECTGWLMAPSFGQLAL